MTKPWADHPIPLIASPTDTDGISELTVKVATDMSFAHNIMIRNLNSLILQFPNVSKPEDIADFIVFCQIVHETIRGHHHLEEKYLFPDIEAYSGQKGIMEKNISQHHAFEEGLKKFSEYIHSVTPETWDRETFRGILDSFIPALSQHLREEIPTLLALNKYGPEKLKKAWDDLEQRIVKGSIDPYRVIPCVLGGFDATFDKKQHAPFPWFVPYLTYFWFMRRHRGLWRFSPCTVFGKPRELPFAQAEK